jgi:hypothetical protein
MGLPTMDLRNVKKAFDASEDDTWKL